MYNKKTNSYHMHPTSHYVDPKKKTDIRKGRAIIMKIKGAEVIQQYISKLVSIMFTVNLLGMILRNMKKQVNYLHIN